MFGAQVIDVAIGLFLLYLILSLACSSIVEGISTVFQVRASVLAKRLRQMLGDERTAALVNHGMMVALGKRPSYVPARTFATALLDTVVRTAEGAPHTFQTLRARLVELRAAEEEATKGKGPQPVQALLAMADRAGGDVGNLMRRVEEWFDSSMERAGGVYKRWSQLFIFLIGIALVAFLNADTMAVTKRLWNDAPLREALRSAATHVTAQAATGDSVALDLSGTVTTIDSVMKARSLQLPLGWHDLPNAPRRNFGGWLYKVVGLLMTAFAVSLGAPFWFDLLSKLVSLRGAGKVPATAAETACLKEEP